MRVFVVDDDPVVRTVTDKLLTRLGHDVNAFASGPEAVAAMQDAPAELVVLDYRMPGMDGEACLVALLDIAPEARIVVSSGLGEASAARALVDRGARAFIEKPYRLADLKAAIEAAMSPGLEGP